MRNAETQSPGLMRHHVRQRARAILPHKQDWWSAPLDQAAMDAVNQWQFEPALLNGVPVEVEVTITINFTLR